MRDVAGLLAAWRGAQRHFEALDDTDEACREAAVAVARAWLDYHLAMGSVGQGEAVLFADDDRRYVAVSPNAEEILGVDPATLLTLTVDDVSPPDAVGTLDQVWGRFMADGEMAGGYEWHTGRDGPIRVDFRARANWPVRHVHLSQLVRVADDSTAAAERADAAWEALRLSREPGEGRELVGGPSRPQPTSILNAAPRPGSIAPEQQRRTRDRAS